MAKRLGLMGNSFRAVMGMNAVYGFDIAVEEAFRSIITYSDTSDFYCMYEPNQYQELIIKRKIRAAKRKNANFHMISELDALWKNQQIDIDVLHSVSMEFLPLYHFRDRFIKGVPPITYTIHGASYPDYINNFYLMQLLAPVKKYDSLICTSTSVKKVVENMHEKISNELMEKRKIDVTYNGRLDVIPLGIDTERFKPMDKMAAREKLGLPKEAFTILWLGRLSAFDKADLYPLLLVTKRLLAANKGKKICLILAGHDREGTPHIDTLKGYAKELEIYDNVIFMQEYNVRNRNEIFCAADVFTSPIDNIQETFGLTPIEAMACGVPQIVSDFDGYKDTVLEGETGFKIPTIWCECTDDINNAGMLPCDMEHRLFLHHILTAQSVVVDVDEYQKKIQLLIDNEELRMRMSQKSRERAVQLYSWNTIIKQYDALWMELMEQAQKEQVKKVKDEMIFMEPSYHKVFKPYVSRFVSNETILMLTVEGKDNCEGKLAYINHYEQEAQLKETGVAWSVLKYLYDRNQNVSIQDVLEYFTEYNESLVKRAVMKLAKQGYIRFGE